MCCSVITRTNEHEIVHIGIVRRFHECVCVCVCVFVSCTCRKCTRLSARRMSESISKNAPCSTRQTMPPNSSVFHIYAYIVHVGTLHVMDKMFALPTNWARGCLVTHPARTNLGNAQDEGMREVKGEGKGAGEGEGKGSGRGKRRGRGRMRTRGSRRGRVRGKGRGCGVRGGLGR